MPTEELRRVSTGVEGLDAILQGGLFAERSYMLRGGPGTGKTLLTFEFLQAGTDAGETALFINLEEDVGDLKANAARIGVDPGPIEFLDLGPTAEVFTENRSYDVFPAADVEQQPVTESIVERVRAVDPDRVVIDPITQLRYLTTDEYQFRKQIVGLMRFLKQRHATVLFTTQATETNPADDLQFLADGAIEVRNTPTGRQIAVPKFRGSGTRSGTHAFRITETGVEVYPELDPGSRQAFTAEAVPSGIPEIDDLLHGGLERGTVSIIAGPTGVGKSTLGTQFMKAAAERGERSVVYLFEENVQTFTTRSEAVDIPIEEMRDRDMLRLEEVEALEKSPQEFAGMVRRRVEQANAEVVMIDGIEGYSLTLRGDPDSIKPRLHALGRYLKNRGVTVILIDETATVTGTFQATDEELSYLADNIVFLRHLELDGELRKAIGVLKKRTSDFERTLREFAITADGIEVGEPLRGLRGVLSGTPEQIDDG